MAAVNMYVRFKETERPDELCPFCHNPALQVFHLQRLDMDGLTILGHRVGCVDCRKFIGPVIPAKEFTQ
ncbi:hypothetical protein SEA_FRANKLIN22_42 [Microbacterium phage Franklin22]|uniref:hypothetical protein n=1 Tax=Microbacterium phage Franklin22 TaxID=2894293 RepID=UPI001E7DD0D8|nr:hypothetical protein QDW15_gp42 [Microbacterium phage Franklin22]UGL61855.1 hypothetical protein SEA_FRANKLIN22_42 [Microbacterium phage Franklin22]